MQSIFDNHRFYLTEGFNLWVDYIYLITQSFMKLAYWMYAGPAHIGTLRVASSFHNVHAIMHAPLGDDYFNVMRSMLERERDFTPVTASIVDRHVLARGSQEKVVHTITRKETEEHPDLILLTPTCTSSILQEDLQNFADRASTESPCDVLLADVNHYRVNELQAADRTFEQVIRFVLDKAYGDKSGNQPPSRSIKPSVNILGIFTLGFHNQHDCRELKRILNDIGIEVNEVLPEGGSMERIKRLPKAWCNIVPYREVGIMAAKYLEKTFNIPYVSISPMGLVDTAACLREVHRVCYPESYINTINDSSPKGLMNPEVSSSNVTTNELERYIDRQTRFICQAAWFSRSIDCQNLTGKKAVVFGDATHAAAFTRILSREIGLSVVCAGTYCTHDADWFREQVQGFCDEVLITDDHTQVNEMITRVEPSAIFGTQMERHIGKRLGIPCGVISAPVHIQNFPLGYRPFVGYEGANNIADLIYNSFTLGMEDHLLEVFGGHDTISTNLQVESTESSSNNISWAPDAQEELNRIPGFVRGKVQKNTERFATEKNIQSITLDVMYAAKEAARS